MDDENWEKKNENTKFSRKESSTSAMDGYVADLFAELTNPLKN